MKLNKKKKKLIIKLENSLLDVMKAMDIGGEKILFVVNDALQLIGCVTDGDIRRWILTNGKLEGSITNYYNPKPITVNDDFDIDKLKSLVLKERYSAIPVIDKERKLVNILLNSEIVDKRSVNLSLDDTVDVVIMAGGKGTRLNPFTHVLPKPLIPINGKPIIQIILKRLMEHNYNKYYISLNEKSKILKAYFNEESFDEKINFVLEEKGLGTIGALNLLKDKISNTFFVVNCDTIVKADYNEVYNFHKENNYDLTILGCVKIQEISYGVCELNKNGLLSSIAEKPIHSFIANTGFYVLNRENIDLIPKNKSFDMTELINKILLNNGRIGVFPISNDSWNDVGNWVEYQKTSKILGNV